MMESDEQAQLYMYMKNRDKSSSFFPGVVKGWSGEKYDDQKELFDNIAARYLHLCIGEWGLPHIWVERAEKHDMVQRPRIMECYQRLLRHWGFERVYTPTQLHYDKLCALMWKKMCPYYPGNPRGGPARRFEQVDDFVDLMYFN